MAKPLLSFVADQVGTDTTDYAPADDVVYMVAFAMGEPEAGGHSWNFSRGFGQDGVPSDDWGVCTVREIQQGVAHGGIDRFRLYRSGVECDFDASAAETLGYAALRITFEVDDELWAELTTVAAVVFRDCRFFSLDQ